MNVSRFGSAAAVLLLAGVAFLGLHFLVDGTGRHAYNRGAVPPASFSVVQGGEYELSTAEGIADIAARGLDTNPVCTYTLEGAQPSALPVAPEGADSRKLHVAGRFIAPVTGRITVSCDGWGPLFVDDAESSTPDLAGFFIVLATITLTVGTALALAALHGRSLPVR